jgi:hypothetical protein
MHTRTTILLGALVRALRIGTAHLDVGAGPKGASV